MNTFDVCILVIIGTIVMVVGSVCLITVLISKGLNNRFEEEKEMLSKRKAILGW